MKIVFSSKVFLVCALKVISFEKGGHFPKKWDIFDLNLLRGNKSSPPNLIKFRIFFIRIISRRVNQKFSFNDEQINFKPRFTDAFK